MAMASSESPSRRERLLEVALDLFVRYGARRTSIDAVAVATGIAKGSVYLEFASKDELFRAVAEHLTSQILEAATAAMTSSEAFPERMTALLSAKFWRLYELVHSRPHAAELIAAKDAVAADIFRRADDRFAGMVVDALEGAADGKQWSPANGYDEKNVAAVLLRAAHGNGYAAGARPLSAPVYRRRLLTAVTIILAGTS